MGQSPLGSSVKSRRKSAVGTAAAFTLWFLIFTSITLAPIIGVPIISVCFLIYLRAFNITAYGLLGNPL